MTTQQLYANSGDINPKFCKGIIESVKAVHPEFKSIPTALVMGFIASESSFRKEVVSSAGAIGLMQVKPDTYKWLKTVYPSLQWQNNSLENPIENILAGMAFILWIRTKGAPESNFFSQIQMYNTGVAGYKNGSRAKDYASKVLTNAFIWIV